eukprot:6446706-Amphidinium_carterae.1
MATFRDRCECALAWTEEERDRVTSFCSPMQLLLISGVAASPSACMECQVIKRAVECWWLRLPLSIFPMRCITKLMDVDEVCSALVPPGAHRS